MSLLLACQASFAVTYPPVGQEATFPSHYPDSLYLLSTEFQHFPDTLPSASSGWVLDASTRMGTKQTAVEVRLFRDDGKLKRVRFTWPQLSPPGNFIDYLHTRDSVGRVIRMDQVHGTDTMSATWSWEQACPTQTTSRYYRELWSIDANGHCDKAVSQNWSDSQWVTSAGGSTYSEIWNNGLKLSEYSFSGKDTTEKTLYTYLPDGRLLEGTIWTNAAGQWRINHHTSVVFEGQRFMSSTTTSYKYGTVSRSSTLSTNPASLAIKSGVASNSSLVSVRITRQGIEFRNASGTAQPLTILSATGKVHSRHNLPASGGLLVPAPKGQGVLLWRTPQGSGTLPMLP
jgi:hypothetical protein